MNARRLAAALVLASLLGGCSSIQVKSDWDRTVNFDNYHSYKWAPTKQQGTYPGQYDLLDKRIRRIVDEEMEYKGFQKAKGTAPDLLLVYRLHTRDKVQIYRDYYYHWGPPGYRAYQYTEGSLSIQIVDAREESVVWEGVGTGAVNQSSNPDSDIQKAVIQILESFPPKY